MVAFDLAQSMGRDAGQARALSQLPGSQGNISIGAHSLLTIQDFTSISVPSLLPEALSSFFAGEEVGRFWTVSILLHATAPSRLGTVYVD